MKAVLKYLGAVLFIGLILLKASAFHVYEHHDAFDGQETQCEFCLLTVDSQQSETLTTVSDFPEEPTTLPEYQGEITAFDLQIISGPDKTRLFSRPPPSLL